MWFVLSMFVLVLIGWAFWRLAKWSQETSDDLTSLEPSDEEKLGMWGIFRKRR